MKKILEELGIYGWKLQDENLVLASLLTGDPLLMIGAHGSAKTHVAYKIAEASGRRFLSYDASKALFEDVLGFPNVESLKAGKVEYVPSAVTIWDKEFVLIDEINRALPGLHSSYWLMRQTIILLPTSVSLFRQVFAGCCEPLLEDGPSRRYLCDPCRGAWVPTPPRLSGAFVRFFPDHIGLILTLRNSARENCPASSFPQGFLSRGCNHSFIFRLPYLLDPPAALTAGFPLATGPYTPRSTRTVAGYRPRHRYMSEPDN